MRSGGVLAAALTCTACGGGNIASDLATAPELDVAGQSKCAVKKSASRPLIVEWPSADRVDLEASLARGPVVVRYDGCEMQLLPLCKAPGRYAYQGVSLKKDLIVITNEDDLYAKIPIGAPNLAAHLRRTGQLNVAMTMVGRWHLGTPQCYEEKLSGSCDGATHVLAGLTVGAFEMFTGASASVGAGVELAGVGAGAKSAATRETLTRDGDPGACDKSEPGKPPTDCGALLRVEVVPIKAKIDYAALSVGQHLSLCDGGDARACYLMGKACWHPSAKEAAHGFFRKACRGGQTDACPYLEYQPSAVGLLDMPTPPSECRGGNAPSAAAAPPDDDSADAEGSPADDGGCVSVMCRCPNGRQSYQPCGTDCRAWCGY
ncbi:MAG: hypothetical protein JRI68_17355 [Deltaproteobacteria bacterium]|nr:hypothetical protein [Deltaproteobacteria bacterium]